MAGAVQIFAVIELSFDPLLHIGELIIRWQTLGVLAALLAGIALAAKLAVDNAIQPPLRMSEMVLILAAVVPGAVVGGRLVHAIVYWDAYAAAPLRLFDPSVGALSLLGAVLGGLLSGGYVGRLIGAPLRRWADAAAVPLLLIIGLGKIAQLLGGSGQGLPFDGPWAVAFTGSGPWVSANADLPSHPSQLYEAVWALIGIPIVIAWADRVNDEGRLFVGALSVFLLGRVLVGFTWRDQATFGPLNMEQTLASLALIGAAICLWVYRGPREHQAR